MSKYLVKIWQYSGEISELLAISLASNVLGKIKLVILSNLTILF